MPDFMGSILVFSIVITIFLFSWNSVESNQQKFSVEDQIRQDAYYTTTFLVSTEGYPSDWNESNVEIPGFATGSENVLSSQKMREFARIDYERQKRLLKTSDFSLNISSEQSNFKKSFGKFSSNSSTAVPFERNVVVRKLDTEGQMIWSFDGRSEQENVVYGINFTIQPDSNTVGNSFNSISIEVDSSSDMFSNTSKEDLIRAGVDKTADGVIDIDLIQDIDEWKVKGETKNEIKIGFSGSAYTNTEAGDSILIELGGIKNPSSGSYDTRIQTSEDGNWRTGEIGVGNSYELQEEQIESELELVIWR